MPNFIPTLPENFNKDRKKVIVVCGHYGSGKTNVAVNLALAYSRDTSFATALADVDIVNPYFRAADSTDLLTSHGVRCIMPEFANTNVDIPSLPPQLKGALLDVRRGDDLRVILDVGGDDDGASAIGGLSHEIGDVEYEMLFCANACRPLTLTAEEAIETMRDIEVRCGLKATAIVNNTNLGVETTAELICESGDYAKRLCELSGLPLAFTSAMHTFDGQLDGVDGDVFYMRNATKQIYSI